MSRRSAILLALLLALVLAAAGCGDGDSEGTTDGTQAPDPRDDLGGEIVVSAASSLTDAFEVIAEEFEAEHPGATITLNFDSSTTIVDQLLTDGIYMDVFASADEENVDRLDEEGLLISPAQPFAYNDLVIVTKPGNPAGITRVQDLPGVGVVALCGETAPCGRLAAHVLEQAGTVLDESTITRGENARSTLTAVSEGDAVAGIVYRTDALSAGELVHTVEIPRDLNGETTYFITELDMSFEPGLQHAFVEFVLDQGQEVLADEGFIPVD